MAKKKLVDIPVKYYAFYDQKSGELLSVSNEKSTDYEHGIEIPQYEATKLISGEWKFSEYIVGKKKQNGIIVKCIMPVLDQDYVFRNNVFEWIEETKKFSELLVEWNLPKKKWIVSLDSSVKDYYKTELLLSKIVIFVTLENDFDFLIRTMYIDIKDLLDLETVEFNFLSKKELDITSLSISSKIVFKSYGLKTVYE